jgi:hypothetical protein
VWYIVAICLTPSGATHGVGEARKMPDEVRGHDLIGDCQVAVVKDIHEKPPSKDFIFC